MRAARYWDGTHSSEASWRRTLAQLRGPVQLGASAVFDAIFAACARAFGNSIPAVPLAISGPGAKEASPDALEACCGSAFAAGVSCVPVGPAPPGKHKRNPATNHAQPQLSVHFGSLCCRLILVSISQHHAHSTRNQMTKIGRDGTRPLRR